MYNMFHQIIFDVSRFPFLRRTQHIYTAHTHMCVCIFVHFMALDSEKNKEQKTQRTHMCRKNRNGNHEKISICANRKWNDVDEKEEKKIAAEAEAKAKNVDRKEKERLKQTNNKRKKSSCVCTIPFLRRFRRFFEN